MSKWILIALILIAFTSAASGEDFEIKEASNDLSEILAVDKATGKESRIKKGGLINGWKITKIEREKITLMKKGQANEILVTQVPIKPNKSANPAFKPRNIPQ